MRVLLAIALSLGCVAPVAGHEFWISAQSYRAEAGQAVRADLLVGSDMAGQAFPWLTRNTQAARLVWEGGSTDLRGREGDMPALTFTPKAEGLVRVIFHARPAFVFFDDAARFRSYLDYEGLGWVLAAHRARGLPETGFSERYIRNARALVQVGAAQAGQRDAPTGMPFELVALQNPYLAGLGAVDVRLTWQGAPAAGQQVALFVKGAAGVTRALFTTDADGVARVPLGAAGEYMLSSVHMEPLEGDKDAVWESHWATLTFAIGG